MEAFNAEGLKPSHVAYRNNDELLSFYMAETNGLVSLMQSGANCSCLVPIGTIADEIVLVEAGVSKFNTGGFAPKVEGHWASTKTFAKAVRIVRMVVGAGFSLWRLQRQEGTFEVKHYAGVVEYRSEE